jgi:hypothetical protein
MSLRYPRFYLFVGHALLWTSPTPSSVVDSHNVRVSHVHVLPLTHTQQNLTPDSPVGFAVLEYSFFLYFFSNVVAGFSIFGSLTTVVFRVTKPNSCSLCVSSLRALMYLFPHTLSQLLQPERQIGLIVIFIQLGS